MSVDVEDVSVRLGETAALAGVSLSARPGELLGVVGPNGAGKTTLLRTINGTLAPDSGRVLVDGDDVTALGARETSRRVATVPQETTLSFEFTVHQVVAMGRHPHRSRLPFRDDPDPGAVEAAMERTDVAQFADRPVTAVSGGERRRVLLARAVAQDAPVTLLDEPTASLDVDHAVRTLGLAADLADDGRTVVAAVHDLDLAARYCDRVALLAGGELLRIGAPESVLAREPLERAFGAGIAVARDPVTDAPLVTALPPDARVRDADRGHVHVVAGDGAGAPLLYPLASAGFEVTTGVVPEGGRAAAAAEALDCEAVTAPPFDAPTTARRRAVDLAARADAVVLALGAVSTGAAPNLAVAEAADRLVVVGGEGATHDGGESKHDGGESKHDGEEAADADAIREAAKTYRRLRERARVTDREGLVAAVAAAVTGRDVNAATASATPDGGSASPGS